MSIKIGGIDISKILVGNGGASPATKIMMGTGSAAVQVWSAVRKVTITAPNGVIFSQGTETGDIDLVSAWTGLSTNVKVEFSADVTCDKKTKSSAINFFNAGEIIPAGTGVQPTSAEGAGLYVFTEVL